MDTKPIVVADSVEFDPKRHVAKIIHDSPQSRVVLFCLEPGQELAAHSSTSEVMFFGVQGRCRAIVGEQAIDLRPKTIVFCSPSTPHGLKAITKSVVMAVITPRP